MEWDFDVDSNRLRMLASSLNFEATGISPELKTHLLD